MAQDYYKTLGVEKNATADEIKSAYRKLVKQYHPDLHPNDPSAAAKFKEINEANEVLSDPQKRSAYDYELENPGRSSFGGNGGFSGAGFSGFGDIFGDIFSQFSGGGGSRQRRNTRGQDLTMEVTLSFLDAALGCKKEFSYSRNEPCAACHNTGAKDGTAYKTCPKCKGTGQIQYKSGNSFFTTVSNRVCDECNGTGKKIITECPICKGKGYTKNNTEIKIDIPAGADNGSYMKKKGFGEASMYDGEPGDLIIVFKVRPHNLFTRKNMDLYINVPISFSTAVLGGKIKIPTLTDCMDYAIPESTQSGKVFCIRGKGIKSARQTGDLYVTVEIEVPTKCTRDQKRAMELFDGDSDIKQTPKMKSFKDEMEKSYGENPYKKN